MARGDKVYYELLDGHMTTQQYKRIVRYRCVPALKALNGGTLEGITWTQDGAPPHREHSVIEYLEGQFGDRLYALGSQQGEEWPPRSPDLNPLDFWAWGYLKMKVFSYPQPRTLQELKARIRAEIQALTPAMIREACLRGFKRRLDKVILAEGGDIE